MPAGPRYSPKARHWGLSGRMRQLLPNTPYRHLGDRTNADAAGVPATAQARDQ
jgi:hypothetical protein